ncbi:MAG: hypothetical protein FJX62_16075 [Alphaproteobacteria bacterium]|nr:hypothetical protein [Alphaproteobacteria bacterium]
MRRNCLARGLAGAALFGLLAGPAAAQTAFQFGLVGDTGYSKSEEQQFERVIAAMNASDLAFVIHVGDFQNDPRPHNRNPDRSSVPCTEASNKRVLASFQRVRHPLVLTPGDNDWTDCHHLKPNPVDPLKALAAVRATFYPKGTSLGGRTMPVESQSSDPAHARYVENQRWSIGGVTFATAHVVGSNDNSGRSPEMDAEQKERKAANLAWIKAAFAKARADGSRGLVLMIQANPGFENHWPPAAKGRYFGPFVGRTGAPAIPAGDAFGDYVALLAEELESYDRPVVLLHGDTHLLRIDKPLYSKKSNRAFENFTRVETFGSPDMHWVRITVDPAYSGLFRFQPEIVAENALSRKGK